MPELTEFILARIAEDEREANVMMRQYREGGDVSSRRWRRVLAECAALRAVVERYEQAARLRQANAEKHAEVSRGGLDNQEQIMALRVHGYELQGRLDGLLYAVTALAAIWSDHPDYRPEEWA